MPSSPSFSRVLLVLGALVLGTPVLRGAPLISEFLASNGNSLADEDGDSSDWIELHNPGGEAIDLGGFRLSDDPERPEGWTIPPGTWLSAGQRLLIFASGKDRSEGDELHADFPLPASGGSLALRSPSGEVVSQFLDYPGQKADISYGLGPALQSGYFADPTPGRPNGSPLPGFTSPVRFSVAGGFHDQALKVTLTCATPGVSIRYTLDGSEPGPAQGLRYTGALQISSTTVIRTLAFREGLLPGAIETRTYLFTRDIVNQPEMHREITRSAAYRAEIHPALKALPAISLSFPEAEVLGPAGIYQNPTRRGRASERRIHFEYWNPDDPSDQVEAPAGLRIHGGNSRLHPKKPLRLYFRSEYGQARLHHDLFPGSPVKSFKRLLLRSGGHDSWNFRPDWIEATLMRNQFLHRVQQQMGQPSPRGRSVNVFLNGQYWGIYELQEFPHEHYNADHHGGEPEDWDVIKHRQEVEAGNRQAWDELMTLARQGIESSADYQAIQQYLDPGNFADAMIQRIWASDEDWLSPYFLGNQELDSFRNDKNWYVARRSRNAQDGPHPFFFYNWDAEMSMGIPFSGLQTPSLDFSRINNDGSPGIIYDALRRNPEFQLFFADRLQKHLFGGGALTTGPLQQTWDDLHEPLDLPMVAESARWGVQIWLWNDRRSPVTRDGHWRPASHWVRNRFIPRRSDHLLSHFRDRGLFPDSPAPRATPAAHQASQPIAVTLTTSDEEGVIYYTTDGSDPRLPSRRFTRSLIAAEAPVRALVPTAETEAQIGSTWLQKAPPQNIESWISGMNGVGFERGIGPGYRDLIATDVGEMWNQNASVYLRYHVHFDDKEAIASLRSLRLRMRYDDGFAAYLNGVSVASAQFDDPSWNGSAAGSRSDEEAVTFSDFDLGLYRSQLQPGRNTLAIHGQNSAPRNNDFFVQATLEAETSTPARVSPSARPYQAPILIDRTTRLKARFLDASGEWSPLLEEQYSLGQPATPRNLTVTEIHYHPLAPRLPGEREVATDQDDFEFLELFNRSDQALDLGGCSFGRGLSFTFPEGATLPAGQRGVLVADRRAFQARYGTTSDGIILGEFARDSRLANGGETLLLRDSAGETIFSFRYDDSSPWPEAADGAGPSLVLISADTSSHGLSLSSSWGASRATHGSPGLSDEPRFAGWLRDRYGNSSGPGTRPTDRPPGETESNLMIYALGLDLGNKPPSPLLFVDGTGSRFARLSYSLRSAHSGVTVTAETSSDLINWEANSRLVSKTVRPDGTTLITVQSPRPITPAQPVFFRVVAGLGP